MRRAHALGIAALSLAFAVAPSCGKEPRPTSATQSEVKRPNKLEDKYWDSIEPTCATKDWSSVPLDDNGTQIYPPKHAMCLVYNTSKQRGIRNKHEKIELKKRVQVKENIHAPFAFKEVVLQSNVGFAYRGLFHWGDLFFTREEATSAKWKKKVLVAVENEPKNPNRQMVGSVETETLYTPRAPALRLLDDPPGVDQEVVILVGGIFPRQVKIAAQRLRDEIKENKGDPTFKGQAPTTLELQWLVTMALVANPYGPITNPEADFLAIPCGRVLDACVRGRCFPYSVFYDRLEDRNAHDDTAKVDKTGPIVNETVLTRVVKTRNVLRAEDFKESDLLRTTWPTKPSKVDPSSGVKELDVAWEPGWSAADVPLFDPSYKVAADQPHLDYFDKKNEKTKLLKKDNRVAMIEFGLLAKLDFYTRPDKPFINNVESPTLWPFDKESSFGSGAVRCDYRRIVTKETQSDQTIFDVTSPARLTARGKLAASGDALTWSAVDEFKPSLKDCAQLPEAQRQRLPSSVEKQLTETEGTEPYRPCVLQGMTSKIETATPETVAEEKANEDNRFRNTILRYYPQQTYAEYMRQRDAMKPVEGPSPPWMAWVHCLAAAGFANPKLLPGHPYLQIAALVLAGEACIHAGTEQWKYWHFQIDEKLPAIPSGPGLSATRPDKVDALVTNAAEVCTLPDALLKAVFESEQKGLDDEGVERTAPAIVKPTDASANYVVRKDLFVTGSFAKQRDFAAMKYFLRAELHLARVKYDWGKLDLAEPFNVVPEPRSTVRCSNAGKGSLPLVDVVMSNEVDRPCRPIQVYESDVRVTPWNEPEVAFEPVAWVLARLPVDEGGALKTKEMSYSGWKPFTWEVLVPLREKDITDPAATLPDLQTLWSAWGARNAAMQVVEGVGAGAGVMNGWLPNIMQLAGIDPRNPSDRITLRAVPPYSAGIGDGHPELKADPRFHGGLCTLENGKTNVLVIRTEKKDGSVTEIKVPLEQALAYQKHDDLKGWWALDGDNRVGIAGPPKVTVGDAFDPAKPRGFLIELPKPDEGASFRIRIAARGWVKARGDAGTKKWVAVTGKQPFSKASVVPVGTWKENPMRLQVKLDPDVYVEGNVKVLVDVLDAKGVLLARHEGDLSLDTMEKVDFGALKDADAMRKVKYTRVPGRVFYAKP